MTNLGVITVRRERAGCYLVAVTGGGRDMVWVCRTQTEASEAAERLASDVGRAVSWEIAR